MNPDTVWVIFYVKFLAEPDHGVKPRFMLSQ